MTIQGLINKLEKAKKKLGKRARVTIDLREVRNGPGMAEEYTHWELNCLNTETIPWAVEDSFELEDGSDRQKTVVVLS